MLSIDLSMNGGIKLLERTLKVRVRGLNKIMQDTTVSSMSPSAEVAITKAEVAVATQISGLKIAKTTMPDVRLDFSDTFLHIRCELDKFYKERNPIFNNTVVPDMWVNKSATTDRAANKSPRHEEFSLDFTCEGDKLADRNVSSPALAVARTVLPDVNLDFSQTFQHIRCELDGFYKERNPNFSNTITREIEISENLTADQDLAGEQPSKVVDRTLAPSDRALAASIKDRSNAVRRYSRERTLSSSDNSNTSATYPAFLIG